MTGSPDPSGPYDAYLFYAVFPYGLGRYFPFSFWTVQNSLAMPFAWWDQITGGLPCYWAVVGVNTTTGEWEIAGPRTYTKSP